MKTLLCGIAAALLWAGLAYGDEPAGGEPAEDAAYTLRYRFDAGETLRSEVVHLVTVETRIRGTTQVAKTRSAAVKVWKIQDVADNGHVTFEHSVAYVDMWQSVTGRQVIRYDSRQDQQPPPGYEAVAESIGVPLSTVTIDSSGRVVERKDNRPQFNPGIGELTVPLPKEPVKVGQQWSEPDEVRIHLPGEPQQRIKTRQLFTLRSVKTGIATIEVKTEVLTPLTDPAVEAQLVQRLQEGTVKFDLDAGRLVARQMDMDRTVVGFNGADSQMEYLARFSEQAIEGGEESTAPAEPPAKAAENSQPVLGPDLRR